MAEFFELTIITKQKIGLNKLDLSLGKEYYTDFLHFFNGNEVVIYENKRDTLWEYEFSVDCTSLFTRENIINKIVVLLESLNDIFKISKFEYAIGNIETNSDFIQNNPDPNYLSNEIILKSSLIILPTNKIEENEINFYHIVFKIDDLICLFNPTSGVLYSAKSDNYKILKESYKI